MNNKMRQILAKLDRVLDSADRLNERLDRIQAERQSQERRILVVADGIGQSTATFKTGHKWHAAHMWHGAGGLKKTGHFG